MTHPDISVVMSVYNGAKYLDGAAQSILKQEVDLELIVIDDGSSDKSPLVLNELALEDERVQVVRQENKGLTRALIRGCELAKGRFIARQDSDDISMPGRLLRLMQELDRQPDLSFVSSWTRCIGPGDEIIHEAKRSADPAVAMNELINKCIGPPAHGSVMFRREAYTKVGGYREEFFFGQDTDLWLRLAEFGGLAYIPEYLYAYRYSPESISSAMRPYQRRFGELGRECFARRSSGKSESELLDEARRLGEIVRRQSQAVYNKNILAANGYYFLGAGLYKRRDSRATEYLWNVIKANPFYWRAWLKLIPSIFQRRKAEEIGSP